MSLRVHRLRLHPLVPEELPHLLFNRCLIQRLRVFLGVLDERRRAVCRQVVLGVFLLLRGDGVQALVHEGPPFGHLREGVSRCHEALVGVTQVLLQQEFKGIVLLCTIV